MKQELKHIAIIPDGNRTRAEKHGIASHLGHQEGYKRTKELLEHIFDEIDTLVGITFWAMSTENMKKRSESEKSFLFTLLEKGLKEIELTLIEKNLGFYRLGDREGISESLLSTLDTLQEKFSHVGRKTFSLLFNYGGKWQLNRAYSLAKQADSASLDERMSLGSLPPVDLIIRTKGQARTSGFLPRETYAERYFTDDLYPDFTIEKLDVAVKDWFTRKRNFGK